MWHVDTDHFPRSLYVLRDENGETLKTEARPGWYRTSSRAKAERDCARLNRKEETMNREQVFELARLKAAELEAARKLEAFEKAHEGTSQPAYPRIFDRWLETVDALERFEQEMDRVAS